MQVEEWRIDLHCRNSTPVDGVGVGAVRQQETHLEVVGRSPGEWLRWPEVGQQAQGLQGRAV